MWHTGDALECINNLFTQIKNSSIIFTQFHYLFLVMLLCHCNQNLIMILGWIKIPYHVDNIFANVSCIPYNDF